MTYGFKIIGIFVYSVKKKAADEELAQRMEHMIHFLKKNIYIITYTVNFRQYNSKINTLDWKATKINPRQLLLLQVLRYIVWHKQNANKYDFATVVFEALYI